MKSEISKRIKEQKKWSNIKLQLELKVEFQKQTPEETRTQSAWFNSGLMTRLNKNIIDDDELKRMFAEIDHKIDTYTNKASGWTVKSLIDFRIKLTEYKPLKASSYMELPKQFQNPVYKLINVKNSDKECFKWSVGRHFCIDERNPARISKRLKKEVEKLNFNGIEFPMKVKDISKFENQNDISVSVYYFQNNFENKLELCPLRISKVKNEDHVLLLYISDENNSHYVLMKDLSPFVNKKQKSKNFICKYCLHSFYKKELLEKHELECSIHTPVKMDLPQGSVKFKSFSKTIKHPFVMYADFESTLKKIQHCKPNPEESYTMNIQRHIPNSFCVKTVSEIDEYSKIKTYCGKNTAKRFVEYIISETHRIHKLMEINKPMQLTYEEKSEYYKAELCYVCNEKFTKENYKVRDHNHLTGNIEEQLI